MVWLQDDREGEALIHHEAPDGENLVCSAESPVQQRGSSDEPARRRETLKNVELRFPDEPAGKDRGICRGKYRQTSVLRHQVRDARKYRWIKNPRWPEFPSCPS